MEEYSNENVEAKATGGRGKFRPWLENFIYHYKWHTIAAVIIIIAVTVCTLQMCKKESYDVYVMYVGGKQFSKIQEDGDTAEYVKMSNSLLRAASDYNGDGEVNLAFDALFLLTPEEIQKKNEELKAEGKNEQVTTSMISSNSEQFNSRMLYSEYYAILISEEVYKQYLNKNGFKFSPLDGYVKDGTEVKYYDEKKDAVYLNSTGFSELPVICDLPEDTLIVLRPLSEVLDKKENRKNFECGEKFVTKMLNY